MDSTDNTGWSNAIDIGWRAADHTCELVATKLPNAHDKIQLDAIHW